MSFVRITRLKLSNFLRNVKNVNNGAQTRNICDKILDLGIGYNDVCQISQNLKNHETQV